MPDGGNDILRNKKADKLQRAGHFRRKRHDEDIIEVVAGQTLKFVHIREKNKLFRLCAFLFGIDIGSFKMNAKNRRL